MGTWDTGPFDNDTAADFANALDNAEPEADEAVAAAALIAAQCPEGEPVDTPYGPETPMPMFPTDLRELADEAVACIAGDDAGSASHWVAQEDWKQRRAMLTRLRAVLAPPPPSFALFEAQP
ncbi:DUF4259 domain-containing protein [Streptomyces mirabilis]